MTEPSTLGRPPLPIRSAVAAIPQASSIMINQIVYDLRRQGRDVTTLSLGEAYFDIPMMDFGKLDFNRGYHYSDSQGLPELRHRIARYYREQYGAPVSGTNDLLISAGSKPLIYMTMLSLLEVGEEVLIHEPAWLSYPEQARLAGATAGFIPYGCPIEDFPKYFSDATRMVVINNPNNPAGRLYTKQDLLNLYNICRPRGIYVMVDEAYSDFVGDLPFYSMACVVEDLDGIIVINSLSKNMGISGWRIGYVIASADVIGALLKVNQHIITCAPTLLLQYCYQYFDEIIEITLPQVQEVVAKRQRIQGMMDELGLTRLSGSSTFYFFVGLDDYPGSSTEFALSLLLDHDIAVVPGSAYGSSTDQFVRVSIGTESEERIFEALIVLLRQIRTHRPDAADLVKRLAAFGLAPGDFARD